MPSFKRGRSLTRSRGSRSRSRSAAMVSVPRSINTTGVQKTWPYSKGMSQMFDPFPGKMKSILRYSEVITIATSTGIAIHHFFRANGIYDPNVTGTGHQPYGHDTLASIYNHYNVLGSMITVTPVSSNQSGTVGITMTDDTTVNADFDTVKEVKPTTFMVINNSSTGLNKITSKFNPDAWWPKTYQKSTQASYGADPSDQVFYDIWAVGKTNNEASVSIDILVTLSYIVESYELKDLGQS